MLVSFLLAGTLATFQPSVTPSPTPPPTIIRIVTSETCNTLHSLMMPIGYVTRRNDRAFTAMAGSMQGFLGLVTPGGIPSKAGGLNHSKDDDPVIYGPGQTINAARIDGDAEQVFGNIWLERKYMKKSLTEYPPGTDPKVDALRQHAQNLIDLQQALANRYEVFAGEYIDNAGAAETDPFDSPSDLAAFKLGVRGALLQDANGLANASYPGSFKSIRDLALGGSSEQVATALREQEYAFTSALISTYDACQDTHFILRPASPPPSPSP
jgi:hypothetical protein